MDLNDFEHSLLRDVSKKLQHLDCTLLGNGEEWWLYELLLTPGIHRFQLFEWILSNLEFNYLKISQPQNSSAEHAKNLLPVLAALGLCQSTDKDLILGKSSKMLQLQFWKKILDILWQKMKKTRGPANNGNGVGDDNEDNTITSECTNIFQSSIEECFRKNCNLIWSVSTGVNINQLFMEKVNLFPPDIKKEAENMSDDCETSTGICHLDDLKAGLKDEINNRQKENKHDFVCHSLDSSENSDFSLMGAGQKSNEEELLKAVVDDSCNLSNNFHHFYDELKPFLKPENVEGSHTGSYFETLHLKQELISEMFANLSLAKSCYFKLHQGSQLLENYEVPNMNTSDDNANMSCTALQSYIEMLQNKLKNS